MNSDLIHLAANINNEGIVLEKAGSISSAIQCYEQSVLRKLVSTHSYERLMILYRKAKEYEKELRVLEVAIEVFSNENDRRAKSAINGYRHRRDDILTALETGEDVREGHWFIFSQYPVMKYIERLNKVKELVTKSITKSKS